MVGVGGGGVDAASSEVECKAECQVKGNPHSLLKEPEAGFEVGLDVACVAALKPPDLSASGLAGCGGLLRREEHAV